MAHEHHSAPVHDCPHHHLGCSPRARRWKVVPADCSPELRPADLPVDVVERRCPRCRRPLGHGLLTKEPPQPPWCPPPAQHVPVRRADSCRVLSYTSVRELAAQPHVAPLPDRVLDAYEEEMTD
jgi:hypothetical protein